VSKLYNVAGILVEIEVLVYFVVCRLELYCRRNLEAWDLYVNTRLLSR